jgi:hypothetical protein
MFVFFYLKYYLEKEMTTHKNTKQHTISKLFGIALLLALAPLFISTAYAWSDDNDDHGHHGHHGHHAPPPLAGVNKYKYKVGDRGPGGGFIFFVDYYDQYRGFTYLEAAPTDIADIYWCNNTDTSIPATGGWAGNAVGKGKANTIAMLEVCTAGAAKEADSYLTSTKSDWFLPSFGEAKLMYDNLIEAGVGGFSGGDYWSSTEVGEGNAWFQSFYTGNRNFTNTWQTLPVRAVRAF